MQRQRAIHYCANCCELTAYGTHLQCTVMVVLPDCCCHRCTWPMISINPVPESGDPTSGHPVYWYWRTTRDALSYYVKDKVHTVHWILCCSEEHVKYIKPFVGNFKYFLKCTTSIFINANTTCTRWFCNLMLCPRLRGLDNSRIPPTLVFASGCDFLFIAFLINTSW